LKTEKFIEFFFQYFSATTKIVGGRKIRKGEKSRRREEEEKGRRAEGERQGRREGKVPA
jgi:hypothetical protein